MAFSLLLGHRLPFTEVQTLGRAGGYTGRLQPLIDSVFAVIAFDHFADLWLPLRGTPGACGNARFATDAEIMFDKNNSITGSLLHGTSWTSGNTPGVFAMKAEHEDEGGSRQTTDELGPNLDNLAQSGALRQVFISFALDFTGMTANAFAGILGEMVPAHENSPLIFL